jgi:large subunit ribosomal protein L25
MEHVVEAQSRPDTGTTAARRLRRTKRVPAVVYGESGVRHISLDARQLDRHLGDEAFRATVLTLKIEGANQMQALLRDLQRHPFRREVLHVDFLEVLQTREINVNVPLHFVNAESSPGVKLHHGIMTVIENEAEIHCLPKDLPEYIEVSVGNLEVGMSVHLSEIAAPAGVQFVALARGADPALAIVSEPAKIEEDKPVEEVAEDEDKPEEKTVDEKKSE